MPKAFNPHDKYFQRAQRMGYRARSVFKLQEIQQKFKILKHGQDVLDLGAAPGSWLQYAVKIVGPQARLVGVDLVDIKKIKPNILLIKLDIFSSAAEKSIRQKHPNKFPIILSDLAPKTSGIKDVDHHRSLELSRRAVELAQKFLSLNGSLIIKVFQGPDFDKFLKQLKTEFKQVKIFKPQASRNRSFEVYLICKK